MHILSSTVILAFQSIFIPRLSLSQGTKDQSESICKKILVDTIQCEDIIKYEKIKIKHIKYLGIAPLEKRLFQVYTKIGYYAKIYLYLLNELKKTNLITTMIWLYKCIHLFNIFHPNTKVSKKGCSISCFSHRKNF